jgi:hypothetical protein
VTTSHFRPRSASELVDAAIQLARANYQPLLVLSAIISLPSLIINLINGQLLPSPSATVDAEWRDRLLLTLPLTLAGTCVFFVGYGALVLSASEAYMHGRVVEPSAALRRAASRAGSLIAGNLLAYMITIGGLFVAAVGMAVLAPMLTRAGANVGGLIGFVAAFSLLLILSLVWLVIALPRYVNVTAVVMLEHAGPLTAVRRSRELSRGSAARILGLLLILLVLFLVVYFTVAGLIGGLVDNAAITGMLSTFVFIPVYPVLGTLFTALYYDLRIRREGYDIELLAQGIGELPASGPAGQASY